jgi:hypothetical protein
VQIPNSLGTTAHLCEGEWDVSAFALAAIRTTNMPKGHQKGNKEARKPKKEKPKTITAAPSQKGTSLGEHKKSK